MTADIMFVHTVCVIKYPQVNVLLHIYSKKICTEETPTETSGEISGSFHLEIWEVL